MTEWYVALYEVGSVIGGIAVLGAVVLSRLLEYVGRKEIDAIAIGTHGESGLSRVLLGSTAEEIVREAPVPVLTVRETLG